MIIKLRSLYEIFVYEIPFHKGIIINMMLQGPVPLTCTRIGITESHINLLVSHDQNYLNFAQYKNIFDIFLGDPGQGLLYKHLRH